MVTGARTPPLTLRIDGCVTEKNTWIDLSNATTEYISGWTTSNYNSTIASPTSGYSAPPSPGEDRYMCTVMVIPALIVTVCV